MTYTDDMVYTVEMVYTVDMGLRWLKGLRRGMLLVNCEATMILLM